MRRELDMVLAQTVAPSVFIAAWMIGIGLLLRADQPAFARLGAGLGALFLVATILNVLGFGLARDATLGVVFVAWIAWDLWLAGLVWRERSPFGDLARSMNHIADILHAAGRPEGSMAHLKRAVALFAEVGNAAPERDPGIWTLAAW